MQESKPRERIGDQHAAGTLTDPRQHRILEGLGLVCVHRSFLLRPSAELARAFEILRGENI